ncbi:MAG: hypothetical protein ABSH08_12045 [Tepidisphaeraceae bacterium]
MPTNTIIIPFRKSAHIPLCLSSLAVCEGVEQHGVMLAQHGGKYFEFEEDALRLIHWRVRDEGAFHFAKLLNAAIKRAHTEWVTILPPDLFVPADYITKLDATLANPACRRCYFPIRYLDSAATQSVETKFNDFYQWIIPCTLNWRRGSETYKRCLIGSECFAVRPACFLEVGGYDERFHQIALTNIEFSRRWLNVFGPPFCSDCHLFHRWGHAGLADDCCLGDAADRRLFAEREGMGFPPLQIADTWGVFPAPVED